MFLPNRPCQIRKRIPSFNVYGEPEDGYAPPVDALCGIVKLTFGVDQTSVRTDSSASRGNADEITADARLLFRPLYDIALGDMIVAEGRTLKVVDVQPRIAVIGRLDHYQVDCNIVTAEETT
jgi:hypothetical protein